MLRDGIVRALFARMATSEGLGVVLELMLFFMLVSSTICGLKKICDKLTNVIQVKYECK